MSRKRITITDIVAYKNMAPDEGHDYYAIVDKVRVFSNTDSQSFDPNNVLEYNTGPRHKLINPPWVFVVINTDYLRIDITAGYSCGDGALFPLAEPGDHVIANPKYVDVPGQIHQHTLTTFQVFEGAPSAGNYTMEFDHVVTVTPSNKVVHTQFKFHYGVEDL